MKSILILCTVRGLMNKREQGSVPKISSNTRERRVRRMDVFVFRLSLLLWISYNTRANSAFSGEWFNKIDWLIDTLIHVLILSVNVEIYADEFKSKVFVHRTLFPFFNFLSELGENISLLHYVKMWRSLHECSYNMTSRWKFYDQRKEVLALSNYFHKTDVNIMPLHTLICLIPPLQNTSYQYSSE